MSNGLQNRRICGVRTSLDFLRTRELRTCCSAHKRLSQRRPHDSTNATSLSSSTLHSSNQSYPTRTLPIVRKLGSRASFSAALPLRSRTSPFSALGRNILSPGFIHFLRWLLALPFLPGERGSGHTPEKFLCDVTHASPNLTQLEQKPSAAGGRPLSLSRRSAAEPHFLHCLGRLS